MTLFVTCDVVSHRSFNFGTVAAQASLSAVKTVFGFFVRGERQDVADLGRLLGPFRPGSGLFLGQFRAGSGCFLDQFRPGSVGITL